VIVDEVPPFVWHGPNAFQAWSSALEAESKKAGITAAKVTLGGPARVERDGDQAYVVVPATYTFTQGGKAMREAAHRTFVLKKDAGGCLVDPWVDVDGPEGCRSDLEINARMSGRSHDV
jgi:ketosteroid isomerase-like protein